MGSVVTAGISHVSLQYLILPSTVLCTCFLPRGFVFVRAPLWCFFLVALGAPVLACVRHAVTSDTTDIVASVIDGPSDAAPSGPGGATNAVASGRVGKVAPNIDDTSDTLPFGTAGANAVASDTVCAVASGASVVAPSVPGSATNAAAPSRVASADAMLPDKVGWVVLWHQDRQVEPL